MSKLWGGRFEKDMSREVARFTSSLELDVRLWKNDIRGSIAHARMLGKQAIIPEKESLEIIAGLETLRAEIEASLSKGVSPFDAEAEDVHSEIERLLREKIGPIAGKLHTARSRNDQVATATRLQIMEEAEELIVSLLRMQRWIVAKAEEETETLLPGLTHFQHGQPVSLAHHLMAYFWMFERDLSRLKDFVKRTSSMPLGSAALAGTSFPLDRVSTAIELGFDNLCENSLDAVSDRDFVIEFLADASLLMMHLSRLCEELIIWSAPEHAYVTLDDSVTTGSSIMPQKKNPDVAELIRGRTGRAFGALVGALTMMKALPLAYNRDMQEDKFHLFQGSDVARSCVTLMAEMLEGAKFDRARMNASVAGDFSNATDLADDLARKGVPFREAHEIVGRVVMHCLKAGVALESLGVNELRSFHPSIDAATVASLKHDAVLKARTSRGGASPTAVREQIAKAKVIIDRG
ncbi:MAG: argininosuccinate lyase [Bdellovibrionota bacterium]